MNDINGFESFQHYVFCLAKADTIPVQNSEFYPGLAEISFK